MINTVTARQIQKDYKRIFDQVRKTNKPVIVFSHSKPTVAIVSIAHLEKISPNVALRKLELEARQAMENGEVEIIDTQEKLEQHFREMDKYSE